MEFRIKFLCIPLNSIKFTLPFKLGPPIICYWYLEFGAWNLEFETSLLR